MTGALISPADLWRTLKRKWRLYCLADTRFRFMWDPPPKNEWISLRCETTGLNPRRDEIVAIAAVRIIENRVMSSERLELLVRPEQRRQSAARVRVHRLREREVARGIRQDDAMEHLMCFVGSRPIVGYYLEFDIAMINRAVMPLIGVGLPQSKIDVSAMYYDYRFRQLPPYQQDSPNIDLSFATLMRELGLPQQHFRDAPGDAILLALAFVKLRHMLKR